MESLEQLQSSMHSLRQLRSIVKTMKALSAASIRQYELAVMSLERYYASIELGLQAMLREKQSAPMLQRRPRQLPRMGAIVFGSDHGLCGRFNEEIAAYTVERMGGVPANPHNRLLLAVGARVAASLEQSGETIEEDFLVPGSVPQITATVREILLKIDEWREKAGVHYVYLFYNRHVSRGSYQPTGIELLPVNLRRFQRLEAAPWPSRSLPTFTMPRETLFKELLRQYFFVSIFRACAESQASEHSSRLTAMQSAEQNLDERLGEVAHSFRRARQGVITAELLDVAAGYEAITTRDE